MRFGQSRGQTNPILGLVVALGLVGWGAFTLQREIRVHAHGHRVLSRVESVSHGRRSSSTTLHFNTASGAPATCRMGGQLGEVGAPIWILYLPESPSTCSLPTHRGYLGPFLALLFGTIGLVGSWTMYQKAKRGEPLT